MMPNPPRALTGGHTDLKSCARGFVSGRGSALLEAGDYDRVVVDFKAVMANPLRFVKEALQPAAAVDLAYIFALRGEADFETVIAQVQPNQNFFIHRDLLTRADLVKMYEANRRSRLKPRSR